MARAKKHYLPGHAWHQSSLYKLRRTGITHRCHKREFLLIENIKEALGFRAKGRKITSSDDTFELREGQVFYGAADKLASGNT